MRIGTTQTNYSRWEAGLNMPGDDAIRALASYFGVSAGWLRYGEETQTGAPHLPMLEAKEAAEQVGTGRAKPRRNRRGR